MGNFILTTYNTKRYTPYRERWLESVEKFKIPYVIYELQDLGDWKQNTYQKIKVIQIVTNLFPGKSVVWCDVDGYFQGYPSLFDEIDREKFDIAVHLSIPNPKWKRAIQEIYHYPHLFNGGMPSTSVIWLANNEVTDGLVLEWMSACGSKTCWKHDQDAFNATLCETKIKFNLYGLPFDYCYIRNFTKSRYFTNDRMDLKEAIIVQGHASKAKLPS